MPTRMLIDARHREETRVAVVKKGRIEELDFESEEHKQLKGNIYLAKVTRVEPSLQAAFVDYGGNRHGFLAFSEIHPDYYQIPKADRDQLLAEEAEHAREEAERRDAEDANAGNGNDEDEPDVEETGDADADEEHHDDPSVQNIRKKRMDLRRRYKIQDVIHRRQVLLVQVVKEERGNKGAALTSYLSLAGRYCVLMPNTSHGGGISRKISNASDRKRLKSIVDELKLPQTMGCIVRTAGMSRTKAEIKRDFTYLARLWDEIREATLGATAPEKIYTDSDLVKRAIRDIYNREIDEVIVEGEDGYKAAKDFMKLLMPSHARRVKPYADATPLFQRYQVEDQLGAMYQPLVQLKSGGYLVINPTEALVSIDINSGRSTREHNIEQTALKTNIEAAKEIARQLRLRDMAGLVVIDFIDMDHHSNNRKVERALKDALKNDRARIQVGRISSFGLLEMSRQRLRTGVLEASTFVCPHCEGTGLMRTASSAGLSALRLIEEEAAKGKGSELLLSCSRDAAVYVLNSKRAELGEIEARYGVTIEVRPDRNLEGATMEIEASGPAPDRPPQIETPVYDDDDEDEDDEDFAEAEAQADEDEEERSEESKPKSKSRRRRGRRGGRGRKSRGQPGQEADGDDSSSESGDQGGGSEDPKADDKQDGPSEEVKSDGDEPDGKAENASEAGDKPKSTRSRTRRSSRSKKPVEAKSGDNKSGEPKDTPATESKSETDAKNDAKSGDEEEAPKKPARRASRSRKTDKAVEPAAKSEKAETAKKPASAKSEPEPVGAGGDEGGDGKPRRGWWQRTFGE